MNNKGAVPIILLFFLLIATIFFGIILLDSIFTAKIPKSLYSEHFVKKEVRKVFPNSEFINVEYTDTESRTEKIYTFKNNDLVFTLEDRVSDNNFLHFSEHKSYCDYLANLMKLKSDEISNFVSKHEKDINISFKTVDKIYLNICINDHKDINKLPMLISEFTNIFDGYFATKHSKSLTLYGINNFLQIQILDKENLLKTVSFPLIYSQFIEETNNISFDYIKLLYINNIIKENRTDPKIPTEELNNCPILTLDNLYINNTLYKTEKENTLIDKNSTYQSKDKYKPIFVYNLTTGKYYAPVDISSDDCSLLINIAKSYYNLSKYETLSRGYILNGIKYEIRNRTIDNTKHFYINEEKQQIDSYFIEDNIFTEGKNEDPQYIELSDFAKMLNMTVEKIDLNTFSVYLSTIY